MASRSPTLKAMRAGAEAKVRPGARVLGLLLQLLLLALFLFPGAAHAEMMKAEVSVTTDRGYARLVITFPEENESDVRLANGIVVIKFKTPVELKIDRIATVAPS